MPGPTTETPAVGQEEGCAQRCGPDRSRPERSSARRVCEPPQPLNSGDIYDAPVGPAHRDVQGIHAWRDHLKVHDRRRAPSAWPLAAPTAARCCSAPTMTSTCEARTSRPPRPPPPAPRNPPCGRSWVTGCCSASASAYSRCSSWAATRCSCSPLWTRLRMSGRSWRSTAAPGAWPARAVSSSRSMTSYACTPLTSRLSRRLSSDAALSRLRSSEVLGRWAGCSPAFTATGCSQASRSRMPSSQGWAVARRSDCCATCVRRSPR
jgi:hypothetical protein